MGIEGPIEGRALFNGSLRIYGGYGVCAFRLRGLKIRAVGLHFRIFGASRVSDEQGLGFRVWGFGV